MQSVIQLPIFLFWRFLSQHMVTCFDCIVSEHYITGLIFFSQLKHIVLLFLFHNPLTYRKWSCYTNIKEDLLCGITLNQRMRHEKATLAG